MINRLIRLLACALLAMVQPLLAADVPSTNAPPGTNGLPAWLTRPLSLADALSIAEAQNAALQKAKKDLEITHAVAVQTRAVALPRLAAGGQYRAIDQGFIDSPSVSGPTPFPVVFEQNDQSWNIGLEVAQTVYDGGRLQSSLRSARLLREQALFDFQTALADTLLNVRVYYSDALLAAEQIIVREASVNLLTQQLDDTRRRQEAGTVPQFNVLRADVELANARPPLSRARNAFRIAKQRLANELGYDVPAGVPEDLPLTLTGRLDAPRAEVELPNALALALQNRTELSSIRVAEKLRKEGVDTAKADYFPRFELFAGYGVQNRQFTPDLTSEIHGWSAGARMNWSLFDGQLTKGRVQEARARHERVRIDYEDARRRIELEVRALYSTFVEAREVLDSQQKVIEQATEALRLASARYEAGADTQLNVLSAQTALTEARTVYVQALHAYSVALARLQRAMGALVTQRGK
ncbi:MAG TPA: TolC family protein [Verrucomicrobiae bacterium]|nr:TolC family protein [Verrucomicrobiae bacterium]